MSESGGELHPAFSSEFERYLDVTYGATYKLCQVNPPLLNQCGAD